MKYWLVLSWHMRVPYIAKFSGKNSKKRAISDAETRNGTILEISKDKIVALDYYYRDPYGIPRPFVWRTIG